jgi:hypothetical protein
VTGEVSSVQEIFAAYLVVRRQKCQNHNKIKSNNLRRTIGSATNSPKIAAFMRSREPKMELAETEKRRFGGGNQTTENRTTNQRKISRRTQAA